jgi:NADH pyrophosphatase NudC (nudix superfamily)
MVDSLSIRKKPWQVRTSKETHTNPYFSILQQQVEVQDAGERTYYTVTFRRPAVGILATRGAEILLIRQYRFIVDEYVWAIPSGAADAGESLGQAAGRELREETGFTAARISPFMHCYASYGCSNQRFEIFHAEDLAIAGEADGAEVLDVRWFNRSEVLQMVESNGIVDNLSLSPILLWLLRTSESND